MRRAASVIAALTLVLALGGCALKMPSAAAPVPPATQTPVPVPQTPVPQMPRPTEGAQVGTTASGGTFTVNPSAADTVPLVMAAVDSTPSREAMEVLATIPEPLGRSTRTETSRAPAAGVAPVAPPASAPAAPGTAGTPAAGDSAATSADSTGVPVPEPTRPLGEGPGSRVTMPDSITASPPSAPASAATAAPATSPAPSASAPTSPDSCWRVQVAAKPERVRSERLMNAAQSQLGVAWVVERENTLYKVRTRDCLSESAAEALRKRAIDAGFEGSFKLRKR